MNAPAQQFIDQVYYHKQTNFKGRNLSKLNLANHKESSKLYKALREHNHYEKPLDFTNANLEGINLEGIWLPYAIFEGANLIEANFRVAHLRCANFRYANVQGTDFKGAFLGDADLSHTQNIIKAIID